MLPAESDLVLDPGATAGRATPAAPAASSTEGSRIASDPLVAEATAIRAERRRVVRALNAAGILAGLHETEADATHLELANDLARADSALADLLSSPERRLRLERALDERAAALRVAARARIDARRRACLAAAADAIVADASRARSVVEGRELTQGERGRIAALRTRARTPEYADDSHDWRSGITSGARRNIVLEALGAVRIRTARQQLRAGLLRTDQMRGILAEAAPALRFGDPVLLIGETGGAKTALAETLARTSTGREPELISGYGEITSAQVIGMHELRAVEGATITEFAAGPMLRAMVEGRPVILDEVNAMPAEFLKRLNRLLQLRPGDDLAVQEDAGRRITIAPGFAVIATANEQTPHRYRGLDRLSAELVNRFGAHTYRVHYPDAQCDYTDTPVENLLLAVASVADQHGRLPAHLSAETMLRVARAAFISQQVFSGAHGAGFTDYVSSERAIDGRPGLEETVLAPRTLVAILRKVAMSPETTSIEHALSRFVEGTMHREDRRVLALILEGQGFRVDRA